MSLSSPICQMVYFIQANSEIFWMGECADAISNGEVLCAWNEELVFAFFFNFILGSQSVLLAL